MAEYKIATADPNGAVIRTIDNAWIPADPGNIDYIAYQVWLTEGGVPDPYVAPPPSTPEATQAQQNAVLLDHENRLRVLAGDPPLTLDTFMQKLLQ